MRRITNLLIILALFLCAIGFSACGGGAADASKDSTLAASVNGKPILLSEVDRQVGQQTGGQQAKLSQQQMANARLTVLDNLIQEEVLFQRAEKEKLVPTEDEISQYLTTQKTQRGMTEDEFQKSLKEQGMTEASLREEAKKLLAVQKLQAKYTGNVSISDHEVEEYYNANRQQFVVGRGLELAEIVVDPRDNGLSDDAKSEAEAKVKIDATYQQLKNVGTERFSEVAMAKSEDASNAQGGDIGFRTQDELKRAGMPESLITQLFGMQPGDYTQPTQFFNGAWYIFKLKKKQLETENRTLESPGVRQEITETLRSQRQNLLNGALLKISLYDARIVNNLAADMLTNPNNLGLRPATVGPTPSSAASPAASATKGLTPSAVTSPVASPTKK